MNPQAIIHSRLWTAVERSYESGDYSGAISDSFYFLSELIREKSSLVSDGAALIAGAFGGDNPVIKVNSLQTETDKSEQKGIEQILRGLYLGLRNPRSHEKREDNQKAADAVILFIDFLVGLIDRSKSPFDIEQILQKVFDKNFAPTKQYADALVARIPPRKRHDVLTEAFYRRAERKGENLRLFIGGLLEVAAEASREAFWKMVSDALEEASSDVDIRTAIEITGANWVKLSDVARLRTENQLISSILQGEYDSSARICLKGAFGSWACRVSEHFLTRQELLDALSTRLGTNDSRASDYVLRFFRNDVLDQDKVLDGLLALRLKKRLEANDQNLFNALWFIPAGRGDNSWIERLGVHMTAFEKRNSEIADEDIPF